MKGIALLALQDPIYGKFAYNLAISIKHHSPNLPIQLIHDDLALAHLQPGHNVWGNGKLFDIKTRIDEADKFDEGRLSIGKAKINLYPYFQFDETVYLDVDSLVVRDITYIFNNVSSDYHTIKVGQKLLNNTDEDFEQMQWASVGTIKRHYNLADDMIIQATNSSFQYWKAGKFCDKLYLQMLANFNNKIPEKDLKMRWGKTAKYDGQPDELYLNIALAQLRHDPSIKNPPLCFRQKKALNVAEDYKKFSILSLYGGQGFTHSTLLRQYDKELSKISTQKLKRHHEFKVKSLIKHKLVDN